jgi:hypothetical protein
MHPDEWILPEKENQEPDAEMKISTREWLWMGDAEGAYRSRTETAR